MKNLFVFLILGFSVASHGESSLYVGPLFGATSYSTSDGSTNRDSQTSYGGEALYSIDHWMGGFSYEAYSLGQSGTPTVNVTQDNQDIEAQVRYRLLKEDLTPFVGVGAGTLIQKVTTRLYQISETSQGSFFIKDVGVGFLGRVLGDFGFSLSVSYYQYSNVDGFKYFISLGYFPLL